ncbi:TonB-dependent receptor plug domain-containing protein [Antarcticibacterium flavum]|uniref:TonB-dependent receptor plug domain-containing protein n=1 Tax=Antarcticibacterium flavum TaxID=2058175 RepID=UPI001FE6CD51|nr:TonB-dependent receptor [Antarcticibacterium flavum]
MGVEHAPNIDINTADRLTVIKGAAALQYGGDAIGGVIIVEPKRPPIKDTIMGKTIMNAASNGRSTGLTSNLLKSYETGLYWKVQGTLKYMGDLQAPDYILSNTGVREKDFSVGIGLNRINYGFDAFYSYFNTDIGILRASQLGNITDLVRVINSGEPNYVEEFTYDINAPRQDVQHQLAKINFFRRFRNAGELKMQYSFQFNERKEFDIRRGAARDRASLDLALQTHNLQTSFNWDQIDNFESTFGINLSFQNNFADPATGVRRLIPDYNLFSAGAFALGSYFLNNDFTIDAGFRYDFNQIDAEKFYLKSRWQERNYDENYSNLIIEDFGSQWLTNPVFNYQNFSASLGGNYQWKQNFSMVMNLSAASRMPNPSELFSDGLHHSAATIELGDLSLQQEKAYKASLGFEGRFDNVDFSVNPYINHIRDFIFLEPLGIEQTIRGAFPVHQYKQVDARLFGIDINIDFQFLEMFNYTTRFAYVNGQDIENNRPIIDMPAPNWSNKIQYYNQSLKDLKIGLGNDLVFKQTRYPNNDFTANIPVDGELTPTLVEISQPPEGYNLWYFDSEVKLPLNNRSNLGIRFSVNNILNTKYRDYLNRQRFYADDLGRNFLIQLKFNY